MPENLPDDAWISRADTPRHHGMGKLMLAVHCLSFGQPSSEFPDRTEGDIRRRVLDCLDDLWLAKLCLERQLPPVLSDELASVTAELEKYRPAIHGHPKTSGLFNGGRGRRGRHIARTLAERILALYWRIQRFDAVATFLEGSSKS